MYGDMKVILFFKNVEGMDSKMNLFSFYQKKKKKKR
jgi:hypothetical protein